MGTSKHYSTKNGSMIKTSSAAFVLTIGKLQCITLFDCIKQLTTHFTRLSKGCTK